MGSNISLVGFTDSVFVLLVIFACWRALSGNTSGGNTKRWKQELAELESSLRDIVSEATIASGTLDKQLLRRQEDLELLLRRIEKVQSGATASLAEARNPIMHAAQLDASHPLTAHQLTNRELATIQFTSANPHDDEDEDLPNPTWRKRTPGATEVAVPAAPLRQQIEMVKANESARAERELLRTIDPAALRVAERLLHGGQEIHVVARKLELSVAQVRAIDARRTQNNDRSPAAVEQPSTRTAAGSNQSLGDIPWTIDRETALL